MQEEANDKQKERAWREKRDRQRVFKKVKKQFLFHFSDFPIPSFSGKEGCSWVVREESVCGQEKAFTLRSTHAECSSAYLSSRGSNRRTIVTTQSLFKHGQQVRTTHRHPIMRHLRFFPTLSLSLSLTHTHTHTHTHARTTRVLSINHCSDAYADLSIEASSSPRMSTCNLSFVVPLIAT